MYLDPGIGSIILQAILAGVLGFGVFIRVNWSRIQTRFFNKKTEDELREDELTEDSEEFENG